MPGPYYFALCGPGETFGPGHLQFDWRIISAELAQEENGLATLTIVTLNPRRGLLNPDEDQWVMYARKHYDDDDVECLFYGRIIGVPDSIAQNKLQVTFRGEPVNFPTLKAAFADTLKDRPNYDKLWIDPGDWEDPDTVLLARTADFHVNRVTHALSLSDKFEGEDGTINFLETDVVRTSVDVQIGQPSASEINCELNVSWAQRATGTVDVTQALVDGFKDADIDGIDSHNAFGIASYTMDVLVENWPLPGDNIGGGWSVEDTVIIDGTNRWISPEQYSANLISMFAAQNQFSDVKSELERILGVAINDSVLVNDTTAKDLPLISVKPSMIVRYNAERERTETVRFTLRCDLQSVVTDAPLPKQFSLSSNDVSEPIDDEALPIGDVRRAVFFPTDRGREALENALLRARKELLDDARSVHITFTARHLHIFNVSLRKNASIIDPRLPGGFAAGKIISYIASIDGNSGLAVCSITIACAVGLGNVLSGEAGTPNYVEEGYVNEGYQTYSDKLILLPTSDLAYTDYDNVETDDDGINFFNMKSADIVQSVIVTNGITAQRSALLLNRFMETEKEISQTVEDNETNVCMNFKPVQGGPFHTDYEIEVEDIVVPQGIDLEAAAVSE